MSDPVYAYHQHPPRPHVFPASRLRHSVGGVGQGAAAGGWTCPCVGRRACCPRSVLVLFLIVLCIYIPLNVIYVVTSSSSGASHSVQYGAKDGQRRDNIAVEVSNIMPGAEGKVDLVLSIDLKDLLRFLDKMAMPDGAATVNPLPRNTSIVLHNPALCQHHELDWLVYVHSAPANTERRMNLRRTWANVNLFKQQRFKVVFLMGQSSVLGTQAVIQEEFKKYGDIVVGDFEDHYKNLTLKGVMGLQWASTYCHNAPLVLKTDDDAFVNIFEVMHILDGYKGTSKLAACPLWKDNSMPILRDPTKCMKWCVKYTEFPGRTHFPKYCAGLTFILSRDLVSEMYKASFSTPFFWIDDVYVTGLLAGKVKDVGYVDFLRNFTLKEKVALDQYSDLSHKPTLYFVHIKQAENFHKFWQLTLQRLPVSDLELLSSETLDMYPDLKLREKLQPAS